MTDNKKEREQYKSMTTFPEKFDVRDKFGTLCPRIKIVYNQGKCRSSWIIVITSVISDRICICSGGKKNIMESAQHLLSCCYECCGCNGGSILKAWDWLLINGIVSGSVYKNKKYKIPPTIPKKYKFPGFDGSWATANLALLGCSSICEDGSIPIVTKRIYVHITGKYEGEHTVGWGTWKNTDYWLAMNSFGNGSWDMGGTFMVPRNEKDNTLFG